MINPFAGASKHGNPGEPEEITSHGKLWKAVHLLQLGQARLEERVRLLWLLNIAIFVAVLARLFGLNP